MSRFIVFREGERGTRVYSYFDGTLARPIADTRVIHTIVTHHCSRLRFSRFITTPTTI